MKDIGIKLLTSIFIIVSYNVVGQKVDLNFDINEASYKNLKLANTFFNNGDYDSAAFYFSRSDLIEMFPQQQYKYALALYIDSDTITSKAIFYQALKNGLQFKNEKYFNASPYIKELSINQAIYEQARKTCYTDSLAMFPDISDSLYAWRELDQSVRKGDSDLVYLKYVDSINRVKLKETIEKIGWPGIKEVGLRGENAAFLIAQHSDEDAVFQKSCLKLMENEMRRGNVTINFYVMLLDRYLINTGNQQIFGTQVEFNESSKKYEPKELKYPNEIEFLRALFSLNRLSDYLEYFNNKN